MLDKMKKLLVRNTLKTGLAIFATVLAGSSLASTVPQILKEHCNRCHLKEGKLQRIDGLRKSPEGWDMTIARMYLWHKDQGALEISREDRRALVKYFADRQGLAPEEAAPYRFLMEKRPSSQDVVPDEDLAQMCARCHSFGRIALQRRSAVEWEKLIHTHLGQFPSIEYSNLGRDRNWKELALTQVAPKLAKLYPAETPAWKSWKARKHAVPTGKWRVSGHRPGMGDYAGYLRVEASGKDHYQVSYVLNYADGNHMSGTGQSIIYSGYEWRGDAVIGNQKVRSVFALSADGKQLSGRWFLREADEKGASFSAVRDGNEAPASIVAVFPSLLKAGSEAHLSVQGVQLGAAYELGAGIKLLSVTQKNANEVELTVSVAEDAPVGLHSLKAKDSGAEIKFAVYKQFDSVRVEPEYGVARLGGGTIPAVTAQFEAVAYLNGPDGLPGTADDIRLGYVDASWSVDNHDEKARAEQDVKYAGVMETQGLFVPAVAGPNPARKGRSNVGDLSVNATVAEGNGSKRASAHLVVSVQAWNKPPLR